MVCSRCILVVREELADLGIKPVFAELGLVKLEGELDDKARAELSKKLYHHGFELLDTAKARLIERVKNIIINKIHHADSLDIKVNWSDLLAKELKHDYTYLSTLFSSVEGITIEQFIIRQKVERVKGLLFYDELTLSEISYKLGYSSVQHLSTQFKKIIGQTPSQFKSSRFKENPRKPLDSLV